MRVTMLMLACYEFHSGLKAPETRKLKKLQSEHVVLVKPTHVFAPAFPHPPSRFLPGLYVVEQMLPAVVDVLQLVVDLRLLRAVAGGDELLPELLEVRLVLAEQVDLLHAVLVQEQKEKKNGIREASA